MLLSDGNEMRYIEDTHDYSAAAGDNPGAELLDELIARFERETRDEWDSREDVGGVIEYRRAGWLVGAYDYENFVGAMSR